MNIEPWFHFEARKLTNTWKLLNILDGYVLLSVSNTNIIMRNRDNDWYVLLIPKKLSYQDVTSNISFNGSTLCFDGLILDENTPYIGNVIITCKSIWELSSIVTQLDSMTYDAVCDEY